MRFVVLALVFIVVVAAGAQPATAQQAPAPPAPGVSRPDDWRFTAFDLAAEEIHTDQLAKDEMVGPDLQARCPKSTAANGALVVKRSSDDRCLEFFDAKTPADLWADVLVPAAPAPKSSALPRSVKFTFDRGIPDAFAATTTVDASVMKIDLANVNLRGQLAYHSTVNRAWSSVEVKNGSATLPVNDSISDGTKVYLRLVDGPGGMALGDGVFELRWSARPEPVAEVDGSCARASRRAADYDWAAFVTSQQSGALEVTGYPRKHVHVAGRDPFATESDTRGQVIKPNSFGLVVVKHQAAHAILFDSGAVVLSEPVVRAIGNAGSAGLSSVATAVAAPGPAFVCTTHEVGPHAPGSFAVEVKAVKPGEEKPISVRKLQVAVVNRYAGAFRTGIAAVFPPDRTFEARTAPGSTSAEIVQTSSVPLELVLGYSVFGSTLCREPGRAYFTTTGEAQQDGHVGILVGFGVVSFADEKIDYLKSVHLGVEYEFSPHFAVAATAVVRRVTELSAGVEVGGPAMSGAVPTETTYAVGAAIVLNLTPSFFKFPASVR